MPRDMSCAPDRLNRYLGFILINSIKNLSIPANIKYLKNNDPATLLVNLILYKYRKIKKPITDSYICVGCTFKIPGWNPD